ncbi:hypothetical protein GCM10011391_14570 [Pullulanibacillus camelliae]|uniref:HTH araC/xylS-type domain-containing protein n=1 Tax=Pullulanibacillus camelliae TaxID=1707096 RepID=A0A8J2YCG6_9BACL|nr:AraC family transcriptional regulator [Pullulanibacillus camelliae]GGE36786.1 hypothetical protein GCM10011391_14570 [Pullulanibacillus camelliae]
MREVLLKELLVLTDEEQAIVQTDKAVRKELYTSQQHFVIESEKFLNPDKMIMIRKHTRFVDFPKHRHNYIELNYVFNGQLRQKVGNKALTLRKGELLFLNQHIEHEIAASQTEDIIINFIIQPEFFEFIFSFLTSENMVTDFLINSLYNTSQNGQFLFFKVAHVKEIQALIQKIIWEMMRPTALSEPTIKLYMGLLMLELTKHLEKIEHDEAYTHQHQLLIEVLNYIESHFKDGSLQALAEQLNQTHYGLSKVIKKETGATFKALLQKKRLSKARELLETTQTPIAMIVEQVGYDNMSYFYRIFKKKYGVTPNQYRQQRMT